jgi:ABC-type branched-subunit amino acid transport system ATPase component
VAGDKLIEPSRERRGTAPAGAHFAGPRLEVAGLVKQFGGVAAVKGLDLVVQRGEALAVIGPNGAGKSTVLKCIAGTHRPSAGTILLDGKRLDRLSPPRVARSGIAMAHQVPRPFRRLTVRENVRLGALHVRGREDQGSVGEILERCGLSGAAARPAGTLGLLDLKRLELAKALSLEPQVLLLDEVAAGLVGDELDMIVELIADVHASGMTIVLVEHVESVVREIVERVVVLDWGQKIAEAAPAEIAADPRVQEVYLGSGQAKIDERPRRAKSTSAATPVLRLRGVSAGYSGMTVLRNIDLEIEPGEIVAVLGANGAGKTTLTRVISGLTPTTAGTVDLFGSDVTTAPTHKRIHMGLAHCQEGRRLFSGLTVLDTLSVAAQTRDARHELRERIEWVCSIFPAITGVLEQGATTLSGGQQQMVAIARALIAKPRLALLDEVSLGLAPVIVDRLYEAIQEINAQGIALLLVEQNVRRCLQVADRVYVLDRGGISYQGAPDALLDEQALRNAYFGGDRHVEVARHRPGHNPRTARTGEDA